MKKHLRLTRKRDFTTTLAGARLHSGSAMLGFAVVRGPGLPRVGVTVSRQVRGAVSRNRAKRRLREAVRTVLLANDSGLLDQGIGYDVVLIARPSALVAEMGVLQADARAILEKIRRLPA